VGAMNEYKGELNILMFNRWRLAYDQPPRDKEVELRYAGCPRDGA
jgi:hypothetical protein